MLWKLGMRPHRVLGSPWFFQRAISEPAGRKWNSAARLLMPYELTHEQNRVAIVSSVITKIFNPCKYWTVTIQPFSKNPTINCLYCLLPVFLARLLFIQCFCSFQCICLIIQCLITQSIFCSETEIVLQVFWSHITTTIRKFIDIIQQTAPSLSF